MALLIYIGDVLLASKNIHEIATIKTYLHDHFTIKDLGKLNFFLSIQVARSAKGITLCQRKYAIDILLETNFLGCNPTAFPMEFKLKLTEHDSSKLLQDPASCRRLVGRLLYLTITRPDLAFSIQTLSHFMVNPTTKHFQAAQRVLR